MAEPVFDLSTPRIMGSEMEYRNQATVMYGSQAFPVVSVKRFVYDYLDPALYRSGSFLSNGARLYEDLGDHMEYSTPEVDSTWEVVRHEIGGGRIIFNALKAAKEAAKITDFHLGNIVSDGTNFWGYHENYLGPASHDKLADYLHPQALHMITRQVFAGSGDVDLDGRYHVSQKMRSTRVLDWGAAHQAKYRPLIDINRNEHHADPALFRRHHTTSGDPHMQEYPAWLQKVTMSVVMRLVEANIDLSDLQITDPVRAASAVDQDLSLNLKLRMENQSARYTALELQEQLALRALKLSDHADLPAEEVVGINEWLTLIDDLRADPDACADRVEWIAKKQFLEAAMTKRGLDWTDLTILKAALDWTSLDPEKGYGLRLGHTRRPIPYGHDISDFTAPPETTRANLRGGLIAAITPYMQQKGLRPISIRDVDWSTCKIGVRSQGIDTSRTLRLIDPYQSQDAAAEEIIAYARAA